MNSFSYLVLVASLLVGAFAVDEKVQIANDYIDEFIESATNGSGGFIDPYPLDDLGQSFEREVGFITLKGEAKLYNGTIYGLSSLQRVGNAVVMDLDDILIMSCALTFKKVHATYKGAVLLNEKGPKFSLDAKIGSSKVSMFLMVPAEGGNSTLMSFTINSLKDIRVSIWGLGPWGWTASIISTIVLNAMEKTVAKASSKVIFLHFSNEIDKVPFPGLPSTGSESYI